MGQLYMTEYEILKDHRQAKDPQAMVQVLADRNLMSYEAMWAYLYDHGAEIDPPPRREGAFAELYRSGLSDREIAEVSGSAPEEVRRWRTREKLPGARPSWGRIDYGAVAKLYRSGLGDQEIAEAVGCHRASVRDWRSRRGLPRNRRRSAERGDA